MSYLERETRSEYYKRRFGDFMTDVWTWIKWGALTIIVCYYAFTIFDFLVYSIYGRGY